MKRSAAVLAAMVLVVTLLVWAGVHNRRERMLAAQRAAENRVVLTPGTQAAAAQAGKDDGGSDAPGENLRGKTAPAFTLADLTGKKVSLADYKGRPVLVNFWATWCAPCKLEMPWFEEFRNKYTGQGFEILGVSMDDVGKDEIEKTARKSGVTYPILLKDEKIGQNYGGVDYLPMSFYVDKAGVVTDVTAGLAGKEQVRAHIEKLLGVSQ